MFSIKTTAKMTKMALAIASLAIAGSSLAATDTANLTVGATVQNACAIGPGTLSFGTTLAMAVNAGAGTQGTTNNVDADSGTTVEIVCTTGASATVTAGLGTNPAESVRKMISGADLLAYELYTASERTTVLDSASGSIAHTGTGANETVTIYGRILGADLAAAKAGTYADTVALTVNYTP